MLSFKWRGDTPGASYPYVTFPKIARLKRVINYNVNQYRDYIDRTSFNLEDDHPLVGFIRHFTVDPTWSAEEAITYIKYYASSLTSMFGIASMSGRGETITDGVFREGFKERWVRLDKDIDYANINDWRTIGSIVPVFHNTDVRTYRDITQKSKVAKDGNREKYSVVAIDVVGLLFGWWLFMNDDTTRFRGIHRYLLEGPLFQASLISNELCFFNSLHDYFVSGITIEDTVKFKGSTFATLDENKLIKEYLEHLIKVYSGRAPRSIHDFLNQYRNIYGMSTNSIVDTNVNGIISQFSWINEIALMRVLQLYITVCTLNGRKASDVNTMVTINSRIIKTNFNRIQDSKFKGLYMSNLDLLLNINDSNYR